MLYHVVFVNFDIYLYIFIYILIIKYSLIYSPPPSSPHFFDLEELGERRRAALRERERNLSLSQREKERNLSLSLSFNNRNTTTIISTGQQ